MTSMSLLVAGSFRLLVAGSWLLAVAGYWLLVRDVRDQRDLARALDRRLQLTLVHRAGARDAPRQDLAALRDERADQLDVLVVDVVDLVRAELADLAAAEQRAALPLGLVAALLVAFAGAAVGSLLSECHGLDLHPVVPIVQVVVAVLRPAFARLALRRQAAPDTAPLRFRLPLRARAVDDLLLLVDAHDHVADDEIDHAEAPVELLHQIARSVHDLEDVHALFVMADVVRETLAPPVLRLLDRAVHALDDRLELLVKLGDLLLGRFRGKDVDELVLTVCCCCCHSLLLLDPGRNW